MSPDPVLRLLYVIPFEKEQLCSCAVAVREVKMSLSSGLIQELTVKCDEPAELIFGQKREEE